MLPMHFNRAPKDPIRTFLEWLFFMFFALFVMFHCNCPRSLRIAATP